jgi:hypothetical protein
VLKSGSSVKSDFYRILVRKIASFSQNLRTCPLFHRQIELAFLVRNICTRVAVEIQDNSGDERPVQDVHP